MSDFVAQTEPQSCGVLEPERLAALRAAFDVLFDAGRRDYAEGGPYGTFAEPETREYVEAKLALLPA